MSSLTSTPGSLSLGGEGDGLPAQPMLYLSLPCLISVPAPSQLWVKCAASLLKFYTLHCLMSGKVLAGSHHRQVVSLSSACRWYHIGQC